jgi:hypothetical protein
MPDLIFIQTALDQTDEQLVAQIRAVMERPADIILAVGGFDDDPRDLWDIPEVRAHFRRLVDFGLIAILVPSTGLGELCPAHLAGCPGLGGFEVWALGHGLLRGGPSTVPEALVGTFTGTVLPAAREALARNLERFAHVPANRGLLIEVPGGD